MIPPVPDTNNQFYLGHINLLRQSYERLIGKTFGPKDLTGLSLAQAIYKAPYVVVSHSTEPDPVFNYANLTAQKLFEFPWAEFCQLPSRQSAEVPNQMERQQLLDTVTRKGFIENYQGIRIAKSGRRFWIKNVTVWNLYDTDGIYQGQGAIYSHWETIG
ncbi:MULTISPECIES: MEKHLA domain-containing protein [unclassified Synechocystis]|uniref:MEKHLA domain-containing protein n=1 Tax=unclassified Synechocystis TaxID=2640012 RepID=UPI0004908D73|nr:MULTISPECIES: MEKHLA domain-containing protein [unclassified Synechocystis]MCT0253707.1 MEKHLA domain-containing protein [Synechocystis sp. CS-94]